MHEWGMAVIQKCMNPWCNNTSMYESMNAWIHVCVNSWMYKFMNELMNEWMNAEIHKNLYVWM